MINSIIKSNFFKQTSTLVSGTAAAQLVIILMSPLLARLYSPSDFGVLSLYSSIVAIIVVIASMRYEHAIVIPKNKKEAINLVFLALIILCIISILLYLIYFIFGHHIINLLNIEGEAIWILLVPISVYFMGSYTVLNFWMTRVANYKTIAKSQVLRSTSVVSTQTFGGLLNIGFIGLIGGQLIGLFCYSVYLFTVFIKEECKNIKSYFDKREIVKLFKEYKDFPLYSAPQALVNSVSQNMLPFLLAIFYSPVVVGWYALSLKFLKIPVDVLGKAVKQVFLQRTSQLINNNKNKELLNIYFKMTFILLLVGLIPAIILFYIGPSLFSFVMGNQWYESGLMARWMVIWLLLIFISRPAIALFQVLRIQKELFSFELISFFIKITILILFGMNFNVFSTIIAFSIFNGIYYCFLVVYIYNYIKSRNKVKI